MRSFTNYILYLLLIISLFFSSCHKEKPWWWVPDSFAEYPCWTPDGSKIAYCREQQIWITDTLGNTWNMFEGCSLEARLPDFSPDGNWLVFVSGHHIYKTAIKENWRVDKSSIVQLTNIGRNFFPKWSPDTNLIVFDSNAHDTLNLLYRIWFMKNDGCEQRRIEGMRGDARQPDWSPNNEEIVYHGFFEESGDYPQIATFSLIDSQINQLTSDSAWNSNPAWSPDGNHIAFFKSIGGTEENKAETDIWLTSPAGLNLAKLTSGSQPAWSPNSRKIAFVDLDKKGEYATIWLIDILSNKRKQIIYKEE